MKLKIKDYFLTAKPKQNEGKLVVRFDRFTVKPKERGVKIYLGKLTSVLKHDRRFGVRIEKTIKNKILKQWD